MQRSRIVSHNSERYSGISGSGDETITMNISRLSFVSTLYDYATPATPATPAIKVKEIGKL